MAKIAKTKLKVTESPKTQKVYAHDSVFFTKDQIVVGAMLVYKGRLWPGTLWEVTGITSDFRGTQGQRPIPMVRHLNDTVHLRKANGTDRRRLSFAAMSYSAIWQMYDPSA